MTGPASTWTREDGDVVRIGITADAATQLGDIIHFEPPELGAQMMAGHSLGELESVKAVVDLLAPIAGEVVEVNEAAVSSPENIGESPESTWLVSIAPA